MKTLFVRIVDCFLLILVLLQPALTQQTPPQQISAFDRDRTTDMLKVIAADIRKHYYDPKFHGLDWDARIDEAKQKIVASPSLNMALSHIAGALDALNDSHTFFLPPPRPYRHDYGFRMLMVGDHCYVTVVRPQSDADGKGLKPGDEILSVNGFHPTREDFWRMEYVFNTLRPQPSLRLDVRSPSGAERQLEVVTKMRETTLVKDFNIWDLVRASESDYRLHRPHYVELGDLMVLKVPEFSFTDAEAADMINRAQKHKALILDLRSNPGGTVDSLKALLGAIFENDIKLGDRIDREGSKPLVAKSRHSPFKGKLAVLIDSYSASASELFARVIQIEKRGSVVGDHSSGSVMEARQFVYQTGTDVVSFYGASITDADLIMTDGKSLEHVGVTPDEVLVPAPADLAEARDPVMAHVAETLGFKVSPEDAGKFFPYEWPK